MKTKTILSVMFAATLSLLACGGDNPNDPMPDPTPTPQPAKGKHLLQQCDMPADASELTVQLQGLTSAVTRKSGSATWLTTTLMEYTGGTPQVHVACTQNLGTAPRTQSVDFIATADTLTLTVSQAAYAGGGTDVGTTTDTPTDQPAFTREAGLAE